MLIIRQLNSDAQIVAAFPLMHLLRDRLKCEEFLSTVRSQQAGGYRLVGGFAGDALVVLAGIRASETLSRGPHLFVDDLVVDPSLRTNGYGRAMLDWIAADAVAQGLPRVYLDSRDTARGFYERVGFHFLTSSTCWIEATASR